MSPSPWKAPRLPRKPKQKERPLPQGLVLEELLEEEWFLKVLRRRHQGLRDQCEVLAVPPQA